MIQCIVGRGGEITECFKQIYNIQYSFIVINPQISKAWDGHKNGLILRTEQEKLGFIWLMSVRIYSLVFLKSITW